MGTEAENKKANSVCRYIVNLEQSLVGVNLRNKISATAFTKKAKNVAEFKIESEALVKCAQKFADTDPKQKIGTALANKAKDMSANKITYNTFKTDFRKIAAPYGAAYQQALTFHGTWAKLVKEDKGNFRQEFTGSQCDCFSEIDGHCTGFVSMYDSFNQEMEAL